MTKIFIIPLVLLSTICFGQIYSQKPPEKTNILFLLDASGSMLGTWDKNYTKMTVAKKLLANLVDSLQNEPNVSVALRVYGHQYHRKYQNCTDTKLEVPFAKNNHQQLISRLKTLTPQGTTPLAYALEQSANDFKVNPLERNIIIIITDGIESCDGDPCAVSRKLQTKHIFLRPFVIGLGLNNDYSKEFDCLGKYFSAKNILTFKKALGKAVFRTLSKTSVSIELLNAQGERKEKDLNVTFINHITEQPIYDFVHYRNAKGITDTLLIDPVMQYDLMVGSIPPIYKKDITIAPGVHNTIKIKVPQGDLEFAFPGQTEYHYDLFATLSNKGKTVNIQSLTSTIKYIANSYDIIINTFPSIVINRFALKPSMTNTIDIPTPGVVNINFKVPGIGSLYQMKQGKQVWVHNFNDKKTKFTSAIQPGSYKVVYRADTTPGSKFTEIRNFVIKSGDTKYVTFF